MGEDKACRSVVIDRSNVGALTSALVFNECMITIIRQTACAAPIG